MKKAVCRKVDGFFYAHTGIRTEQPGKPRVINQGRDWFKKREERPPSQPPATHSVLTF
jgi:hypothetical protein